MGPIRMSGRPVVAAVSGILASFAMARIESSTANAQPEQQEPSPQPPVAQPADAQQRTAPQPASREPSAPRPRVFQLAVTGLLGRIRASRDGETESENGRGFAIGAAFYPFPRIALVSEVWWQYGSFDACTTDFTCIRSLGKRHTIISVGLRYEPVAALSLDLAAGKHITYINQGSVNFSRESVMVLATAAWHAPLRPVEVAVMLRVGTTKVQDAQLTTAVLGLQLGKSW